MHPKQTALHPSKLVSTQSELHWPQWPRKGSLSVTRWLLWASGCLCCRLIRWMAWSAGLIWAGRGLGNEAAASLRALLLKRWCLSLPGFWGLLWACVSALCPTFPYF